MKNLLLLGPPGSGKGTQANKLVKESNYQRIDTGSLIREAIKKETDLGVVAKNYVTKGKLAPDNLIIDLIIGKIKLIVSEEQKFLLDGFPRNRVQAEALTAALPTIPTSLDLAIEILLDYTKLTERIVKRRICTNKDCGAVYHQQLAPPLRMGICDLCGSNLYQRDDDQPELVKSRLETYQNATLPLVDYYTEKGILVRVNGDNSPDQVFTQLKSFL